MPGGRRQERERKLYQGRLDRQEILPEAVNLSSGHLAGFVIQEGPRGSDNSPNYILVHRDNIDALLPILYPDPGQPAAVETVELNLDLTPIPPSQPPPTSALVANQNPKPPSVTPRPSQSTRVVGPLATTFAASSAGPLAQSTASTGSGSLAQSTASTGSVQLAQSTASTGSVQLAQSTASIGSGPAASKPSQGTSVLDLLQRKRESETFTPDPNPHHGSYASVPIVPFPRAAALALQSSSTSNPSSGSGLKRQASPKNLPGASRAVRPSVSATSSGSQASPASETLESLSPGTALARAAPKEARELLRKGRILAKIRNGNYSIALDLHHTLDDSGRQSFIPQDRIAVLKELHSYGFKLYVLSYIGLNLENSREAQEESQRKRSQARERVAWLAQQLDLRFCADWSPARPLAHSDLPIIICDRKTWSSHHVGQLLNGKISVLTAHQTVCLIDDDKAICQQCWLNQVLAYQCGNRRRYFEQAFPEILTRVGFEHSATFGFEETCKYLINDVLSGRFFEKLDYLATLAPTITELPQPLNVGA